MSAQDPSEILRRAVSGMLPKNNLRKVSSACAHRLSIVAAVGANVGTADRQCVCSHPGSVNAPDVLSSCSDLHSVPSGVPANPAKSLILQARDRKLRIFPDADHPFKDHPQLVHWQPPPRKLRVKHPLWELEEGFEPMNPQVKTASNLFFRSAVHDCVIASFVLPPTNQLRRCECTSWLGRATPTHWI